MIEKKERVEVKLSKRPKKVTIIEGFPGFGLVGTIATGFLVEHLKCERIGTYYFENGPATLAIHECTVVQPIGIFYSKKYNLVIVHAIMSPQGLDWQAADVILDLAKQTDAKEIIAVEGVGSTEAEESRGFFHSIGSETNYQRMKKAGVSCLKEGIVVGVTSALMMKSPIPVTAVFAETHTNMPDSKAAAKIVEILDKYLDLKVSYAPLLKQAEEFEHKLMGMMEKGSQSAEIQKHKAMSYVG